MGVSAYRAGGERRYKAILYVDGVPVTSRRGFTSKKAAQQWMQEARKTLQEPLPEKETSTAFMSVAHAYLNDMEIRRQHNTYRYKRSTINRFLAYMDGDFLLDDLTVSHISNYLTIQHQTRGPKAANRDLLELKAVLNWAIRKDLCQNNPFRRVDPYPEEKFTRYVPPAEDVQKVMAVAIGQERDFIELLYYTGARLSEACSLRWQDVDFQAHTITLWTRKRRGGGHEARTMAMVPALEQRLADRAKAPDCHPEAVFTNPGTGKPLVKNVAWTIKLMDDLCQRAGVRRFTAHCIRHFVATRLKDSHRATPFQIQNFLGHQNLSTTERYLHELDVDRSIAAILAEPLSDKIEPQIEPQANLQREWGLSVIPEKPRHS